MKQNREERQERQERRERQSVAKGTRFDAPRSHAPTSRWAPVLLDLKNMTKKSSFSCSLDLMSFACSKIDVPQEHNENVPKGHNDNSPAFQRRVIGHRVKSPVGTAENRYV